MSEALFRLLSPFQRETEAALIKKMSVFGKKTPLKDACEYALTQGGKRFRPALVLMIARALNCPHDVMDAALSVEYFHTASLLADDLPCMDDDKERRGKPSTHVVYGESTALLASYALIAEGYRCLSVNASELVRLGVANGHSIGILSIENASHNTGIEGATGGQYIDLYPPKIDEPTYIETVLKKTVALFEISFVLGWLFGGGSIDRLPLVKKAAYHYGMAFQIADDFDDFKEDSANERMMNAVSLLGPKEALDLFQEELKGYRVCLTALNIASKELLGIADCLDEMLQSAS